MRTRAPGERERIVYGPSDVPVPESTEELAAMIRDAEADGRRLRPAGLGAHTDGADGAATPVSLSAFDDVVLYEPDDFTIGVGAGMPLARLRDELARHGQELPIDFGADAPGTIGGLVARAPVFPRQSAVGPLSAMLLGAEGVRGGGVPFRAGGQVVKNVSGYQHHKLQVGASGRLGFLTRVNFRLRPKPAARRVGFVPARDIAAATRTAAALRASGTEAVIHVLGGATIPAMRDAGVPVRDAALVVSWMLEGRAERVEALVQRARAAAPDADVADDATAERFLNALADRMEPAGPLVQEAVVRISVLPTRVLELAEEAVTRLEARGAGTAWITDPGTGVLHVRAAADDPPTGLTLLRDLAMRRGGVARRLGVLAPPHHGLPRLLTEDPHAELARKLTQVFDPAGAIAGPAGGTP